MLIKVHAGDKTKLFQQMSALLSDEASGWKTKKDASFLFMAWMCSEPLFPFAEELIRNAGGAAAKWSESDDERGRWE